MYRQKVKRRSQLLWFLGMVSVAINVGCGTSLDVVRPVVPINIVEDSAPWPDFIELGDIATLADAERAIPASRQGEFLLTVLGDDRFPVEDVEVEWKQLSHQFAFGVSGASDPQVSGDLLRAGVNRGELNLAWNTVADAEGSLDVFASAARRGSHMLHHMGMQMVAGETLLASANTLPSSITDLSPSAFLVAAQRQIRTLASALKGNIALWEAVSQANISAGGQLEEPDMVVLLAQRVIDILHEVDPSVPVAVSFETPMEEKESIDPIALLTRLDAADIAYDRIGLRILENGYNVDGQLQPRRSLVNLSAHLDSFKRFQRPIDILGFAVPGASNASAPDIVGHWGRHWSPELQAVYLRAALTLAFSKPHVVGMTWSGALDADSSVPAGGLFSAPNVPKPSYHALAECISRWTTSGAGEVNSEGQLRFRGYGGVYRLTVRDPLTGRAVVQTVRLRERELRSHTIRLPRELTHRAAGGPQGTAR